VPNMPGAVPQTSTWALTNVTIGHAVRMAALGPLRAVREDAALYAGVNTFAGAVTCAPVAEAHALPYTELSSLLGP